MLALSFWTSFADSHGAAAKVLALELLDGASSFFVGRHFYETKAFGAVGVAVYDDLGAGDSTSLAKEVSQVLVCGSPCQRSDK